MLRRCVKGESKEQLLEICHLPGRRQMLQKPLEVLIIQAEVLKTLALEARLHQLAMSRPKVSVGGENARADQTIERDFASRTCQEIAPLSLKDRFDVCRIDGSQLRRPENG